MTPTSIPSAVKARIEAEAIAETNWTKAEQAAFIIGMERMYCNLTHKNKEMVNIHRGYKIYMENNEEDGGFIWIVKSLNNATVYQVGCEETEEDALTSGEKFINELIEKESL